MREAQLAVRFIPQSMNRKLGMVALSPTRNRPRFSPLRPYVSSTLVSIQATCPDSCPFKGTPAAPGGCYVDAGYTRISLEKMDRAAWGLSSVDVNLEEAQQIDAAFRGGRIPQDGACGGRDLRLHVGGDVDDPRGAAALGEAARRWRKRGGGSVWTYTHAWRTVPRRAWGDSISVLASVERPADIEKARRRGYTSAIVVESFPDGDKAFRLPGATASIVPCPAETHGVTCIECRLCLDVDLHASNHSIAFAVHGRHEAAAISALRLGH